MLEKIREKWKKRVEEAEKKDIEYTKNHPRVWIGTMVFFLVLYLVIATYVVLQDIYFIVFALIMFVSLISITKHMWNIYREAFPKLS